MKAEESLSSKRLLLVVKRGSMVSMNVTFASSRKVAKRGVDVNVHVEEAASVRECPRGLRELRGLFASFVVYVSCVR
jgi:hypothetical protein